MYYICHEVNSKRDYSYIRFSRLDRKKKARITLKNDDDDVFNMQQQSSWIAKRLRCIHKKVSNIGSFINKYKWEE